MKNEPTDVKDTTDSSPVMITEEVPQAEAESALEEIREAEAEPEVPEAPKEETETVEVPKKGAQQRIQELVSEKKQAEEKAKGLEEKLAELTSPVGHETPQAPYTPQVTPGQELTTDQYKQDVLSTAQALVDLRVKQSEAVQRINSEASQAVRKYPQLDPESDQFNRELSDSVTEATMAYVKAEPFTASPKKFVDKMIKPYLQAVTQEVGKATENIAKQVSQAAVRPTSVQRSEKPFKDLSIKEMEKKLGVVTP